MLKSTQCYMFKIIHVWSAIAVACDAKYFSTLLKFQSVIKSMEDYLLQMRLRQRKIIVSYADVFLSVTNCKNQQLAYNIHILYITEHLVYNETVIAATKYAQNHKTNKLALKIGLSVL